MSLIWGVPYLFIKVAVDDGVSPAFLSFARVAMAAALLLALAWQRGRAGAAARPLALGRGLRGGRDRAAVPADRGRRAARLVVAGGDPDRLRAADRGACSRSASTPPSARPASACVGLLIGFAGVVALVGIDVAGKTDELLGTALIVLAASATRSGRWCSSASSPDVDARATMGAHAWLIAAVAARDPGGASRRRREMPTGEALGSLVVLGAGLHRARASSSSAS